MRATPTFNRLNLLLTGFISTYAKISLPALSLRIDFRLSKRRSKPCPPSGTNNWRAVFRSPVLWHRAVLVIVTAKCYSANLS